MDAGSLFPQVGLILTCVRDDNINFVGWALAQQWRTDEHCSAKAQPTMILIPRFNVDEALG